MCFTPAGQALGSHLNDIAVPQEEHGMSFLQRRRQALATTSTQPEGQFEDGDDDDEYDYDDSSVVDDDDGDDDDSETLVASSHSTMEMVKDPTAEDCSAMLFVTRILYYRMLMFRNKMSDFLQEADGMGWFKEPATTVLPVNATIDSCFSSMYSLLEDEQETVRDYIDFCSVVAPYYDSYWYRLSSDECPSADCLLPSELNSTFESIPNAFMFTRRFSAAQWHADFLRYSLHLSDMAKTYSDSSLADVCDGILSKVSSEMKRYLSGEGYTFRPPHMRGNNNPLDWLCVRIGDLPVDPSMMPGYEEEGEGEAPLVDEGRDATANENGDDDDDAEEEDKEAGRGDGDRLVPQPTLEQMLSSSWSIPPPGFDFEGMRGTQEEEGEAGDDPAKENWFSGSNVDAMNRVSQLFPGLP